MIQKMMDSIQLRNHHSLPLRIQPSMLNRCFLSNLYYIVSIEYLKNIEDSLH